MTMTNGDGGGAVPTGGQEGATDGPPQLNALTQFAKDLSFENPNAPRSLAPQTSSPQINIQVNVGAKQLSETDYEVELTLEGQAGEGANILFTFELKYGGVFRLRNIPEAQLHPVVMIECPRLLFPFARNILADVTREGGFPRVMLAPIDFVALWQSRRADGPVVGTA